MTIVAISDTHGRHNQLDMSKYPADVLIHAGDWTRGRDLGLSETIEFLEWLEAQPYKHKLFIAGNHEVQVEADQARFSHILSTYPSITYLHHKTITIDGINFYGSNYSNEFCGWAFMKKELGLEEIWDKIPDDTNVLITHGPAYGTHDQVKHAYGCDPNVGSESLVYRKRELEGTLKLHISGHIHEAYGISGTNPTNICASVLNENYQLVNNPIIITIKDIK